MKLNEAVSKRLLELLDERKMTQYQLYMKSGVPKSTIGNVINCSYDSVKLRIIHEMCQGMGIGIDTFFASPLFQEDMGILSLERVQILPQDGLSAHGVHQGDLHAGELDVCGHQVNALRVVQDTLAGAQRLVHQDTAHRVGQGKGQLVRLGVAQADGQAALRVPVDQQHFLSGLRQPNPQVRAGGCLANAAFLVGDGDDLRVQ